MSEILLATLLVAGIVILTPLADRWRTPLPVLLTIFGLAVPLIPGTPHLRIEPELILPLVLPPLLFAATTRSTVHEFRRSAQPILLLAVGLTVASTVAVAWLAHLGGLGWGPAFVLGAVVAPPDPVAATAVARRLKLPQNLVTLLEGEGMFNDATALVLYSVAVLAVVQDSISGGEVVLRLVLAVVAGVAVGLIAGVVTRLALGALRDAFAETTVTVAMPFVAYLVAEQVLGSGVLAVLTLGLFLRSFGHPALTSGGWLIGRSVWRFTDYLVTSFVFVLIGFELTDVLGASHVDRTTMALAAGTIVLLVVVRFAWIYPATYLERGRPSASPETPTDPRETAVAAWAGMRGVVTIATALALPDLTDAGRPFDDRATIVFIGLVCVLGTLVVQGLTLGPLVKALGVGTESDTVREAAELRLHAANVALEHVRGATQPRPDDHVRRAVMLQYEGYIAAQDALGLAKGITTDDERADPEQLDRVLREANEIERDVVLAARRAGSVSSEAADEVLEDIEARAVRDLS